jgi:hypothetical protein
MKQQIQVAAKENMQIAGVIALIAFIIGIAFMLR